MEKVCVFLLGRFHATWQGVPLPGLENQKVQELLGYLLLNPNRCHHRDKLAGLLWEECDDLSQARKYLRKALWRLRAAFGEVALLHGLVDADGEWISLHPSAALWSDTAAVEQAFTIARSRPAGQFTGENVATLQEAAGLNQGEFMEGRLPEWCLFERERFQLMRIAILDRLMAYFEKENAPQSSCDYGLQILQIDPAREGTHRRLMRNYYRAGNRAAALRQYEQCARILKEEFDLEPGHKTQTLYRQIARDDGQDPPARPSSWTTSQLAEEIRELKTLVRHLASSLNITL